MQPFFAFSVLNATSTTRNSGFDELFADGAVVTAELRVPTQFFAPAANALAGAGTIASSPRWDEILASYCQMFPSISNRGLGESITTLTNTL